MGWEKRGNNRYYYRKTRKRNRIISEYFGCGHLASLAAARDEIVRKRNQETNIKKRLEEQQFHNLLTLDQKMQEFEKKTNAILKAAFLLSGYHTHHREWRKKNDRPK